MLLCTLHSATHSTIPTPTDSVYTHSNRVAESPSHPAAPLSVQQAEQAGSAARAGGAVVFLVYFCACFYSLRGTRKMGSADWKRAAAAAVVAFIAQLGGILLSVAERAASVGGSPPSPLHCLCCTCGCAPLADWRPRWRLGAVCGMWRAMRGVWHAACSVCGKWEGGKGCGVSARTCGWQFFLFYATSHATHVARCTSRAHLAARDSLANAKRKQNWEMSFLWGEHGVCVMQVVLMIYWFHKKATDLGKGIPIRVRWLT